MPSRPSAPAPPPPCAHSGSSAQRTPPPPPPHFAALPLTPPRRPPHLPVRPHGQRVDLVALLPRRVHHAVGARVQVHDGVALRGVAVRKGFSRCARC